MLDYQQRLDSIMLQLQNIIDEKYEENDSVQTAFNNLAISLDEEYNECYNIDNTR
jgi:hypothetical protein